MNAWSLEEFNELTSKFSNEEAKIWINTANKSFHELAKEKSVSESMTLAREAAEKAVKDFKAEQTFNIEGVEIFSVGKWNGDPYTQKDLDDMVAAFDKVGFQPPLKLGHNKEQEREIHRDGQPALGWVEKLSTSGGKLLADFSHVPLKVYEAIKRKNFATISSEIYFNCDFNGKEFSRVLRAVSLLGADIPAVGGLQQIVDLYTKEGDNASSEDFKIYTTKEENSNEEDEVTKEEFDKQIKEEKDKTEAAEKALKKVEEERALSIKDTEKAEAELAKVQADAKLTETDTLIKTLKKDGKITPAFEEEAKALLMSASDSKCFTYAGENNKAVELSQRETVIRFFNALGKQVNFGEQGPGGGSGEESDDYTNRKEAGDELHRRATELMKKDNNVKTYSDASTRILNADPALKAAYAS